MPGGRHGEDRRDGADLKREALAPCRGGVQGGGRGGMIQTYTVCESADNSGARKLMCIRVLGGSNRKYASLGDVIVVSVKEALPRAKIKKGDVKRAVIVRTAKEG